MRVLAADSSISLSLKVSLFCHRLTGFYGDVSATMLVKVELSHTGTGEWMLAENSLAKIFILLSFI